MWKCFNRGVWETIDRSVTVFKVDTSNGTCLISSLAKDLEGKNEEFKRSKPQTCSEDKVGICHVSETRNLLPEHQTRRQTLNRKTGKIHGHARFSKVFSRDLRHSRTVTASQNLDKSQAPSISEEVNVRSYNDCHQPPGINSCIGHTISGKCECECSCNRRPSSDSDYISESHLVDEGRFLYPSESSEANIKLKLQPQSLSKSTKSIIFPEKRRELHLSTSKLHEACLPKSNFSPLFSKVKLLCNGRDIKEEKIVSPNEKVQPQDFVYSNSHAKSNCMLKLPFLCYDLGRFKGINKVSASWLMKPRSEFGRGDSGGPGGEQNGESEETKEDAWRECQMHRSFLEAIGWSSAVLFGWFLGQFRFRSIHGELRRDNSENKEKCCIIGSLANLLVTWRGEAALPLKVLPSKTDGISKEHREKKGSNVHGSETPVMNEPYSECPPNPFLVLEKEENFCERPSSSNYLILQNTEVNSYQKGHLKPKLDSINGAEKSDAIPMPWHVDSVNNLMYGPITLEEAIKEAGKGLEEAQAEVLLTLALEKLNEAGCSSTQSEPLPADLFQSAASLGSAAAAFNLGICYEKGVGGVVKNLVQAYHWYKQASELGHAAATYNLAVFHANGLGGLNPNNFLAYKLLLKASTLGLEAATDALGHISFNSSDIICNDIDSSPLRNHVSVDQCNDDSSNSFITPSMSKSCSSEGPKNKQDLMSMYSESYHESSNDHLSMSLMTDGVVSQPSEYIKETTKMSSLKIDHLLMSHGIALNNSIDTSSPLLEEIMFDDHHCIKNRGVDNSLVQLLAH